MSKTHEERENQSLIDLANTTTDDLYALLSLKNPFTGSEEEPAREITKSELSKGWRQAALKWHPDKNRGNEEAAATKLDLCRKAYEVLSDPGARQRYDEKLRARQQWEIRHRAKDQRRRKLAEDLEKQESAAFGNGKRKREEETAVNRKEMEAQRLAEKARQMKMARNQQRQQEANEEAEKAQRLERQKDTTNASNPVPASTTKNGAANGAASETDRTVKVRWISPKAVENDGADSEPTPEFKAKVRKLFSNFGEIEDMYFLKNKMARPSVDDPIPKGGESKTSKKPKKRLMSTAAIVFKSSVGAYAAVWDAPRQAQLEHQNWEGFDSCYWWSGSEPTVGTNGSSTTNGNSEPPASKSTPSFTFKNQTQSFPTNTIDGENHLDEVTPRNETLEKEPCIECGQRKVRCDKKKPCSNCTAHGSECIYSSQTPSTLGQSGGLPKFKRDIPTAGLGSNDSEAARARIRKEEIDRILREEAAEEAAGENGPTDDVMDQEF